MELQAAVKKRAVFRSSVTKLVDATLLMLSIGSEGEIDLISIKANRMLMQEKMSVLSSLDEVVFELLLAAGKDEDELEHELDGVDVYKNKYTTLCVKIDDIEVREGVDHKSTVESKHRNKPTKCKYKLPKVELKKFGGELTEWLSFWSQFSKIDADDELDDTDKFQYLVQSTIPGSRAREVLESFPQIKENYPKAVECLKSRFGREDILIEVYTRELLNLTLKGMSDRCQLSTLYDSLETKLRALETLGVTSERCSAMLFPLVESCLSADLLLAWQRSGVGYQEGKGRLQNLLEFLRKEVEHEERIFIAMEGFNINDKQVSREKMVSDFCSADANPATAAVLINTKGKQNGAVCVFCQGAHFSGDCFKARQMTLVEKRRILNTNHCCFVCLRDGHIAKKCKMTCLICGAKHVPLMCPKLEEIRSESQERKGVNNEEKVLANRSSSDTFLQTLTARLKGKGGDQCVRILIDTGSQRSYIDKEVAVEMGYQSLGNEQFRHGLFGGHQSHEVNHNRFRITLENLHNDYVCNFDALDQDTICCAVPTVPKGVVETTLKATGIEINDSDGPVQVLVGADVAGKLLTGERIVLKNGLVAINTYLGWTPMGKIPDSLLCSQTMTFSSLFSSEMPISTLWELDVLGIGDPERQRTKEARISATREHFERTVKKNMDGRYEVELPWLEGHPPLPSNYHMALKRLQKLNNKLITTETGSVYAEVFEEWKRDGIIEEVKNFSPDFGHYLPHRPVMKEQGTTKVRPVFDASRKVPPHPSLNDCLEEGPNLIEDIPHLLLNFRLNSVGVIADIKKAFLQISLSERDRDFVRFLWRNESGELVSLRHTRVVFGITSSPFLLGAVIERHLADVLHDCICGRNSYSQETITKLQKSLYVDNCVTSIKQSELHKFIEESTDIFREARFELRGWEHTNSAIDNDIMTPVLGLLWSRGADTLSVSTAVTEIVTEPVTKRKILSAAHKLFDPIGFTVPVSLGPKLLVQQLWKDNLDWDASVPKTIEDHFRKWAKTLHWLKNIAIPRYITKEEAKLSLHIFCDACQSAYAAVVFVRVESSSGTEVHLIEAKARVAPTKKTTIPRLELLAATIATRLASRIAFNLQICRTDFQFWSDSSTVITWIQRDEPWGVFVSNRVQEIRQLSEKESWRHIAGKMNPADLPSRGCTADVLFQSKWWLGPEWLKKTPAEWPVSVYAISNDEVNAEKRQSSLVSLTNSNVAHDWYYQYFSQYTKILRLLGWILRFLHNCQHSQHKTMGELDATEINNAEEHLIKFIQGESFCGIKDERIKSLMPFKDKHGVIRIKTKIVERNDVFEFRYPAVLPSDHPVVARLIHGLHLQLNHVGAQGLLSALRERFWIIRGRRTVRSVIGKCIVCKRFQGNHVERDTPPLPEDRVRDASTFEICGVDMAGPMYLKDGDKAWICIFTCAVYRAVHLEVVTSLSTNTFIQAVRRFVARRGRPTVIYSVNGTNFVGADQAFSRLDWSKIQCFSSTRRFIWKFNPPTAAWWGGWWERLIGMLKSLLRRVLGRAMLNFEELFTVVCDCEAIMNSRPLTYLSEDARDLVALTPAMFLQDIKEIGVPECDQVESVDIKGRVRYLQKLREDIRKRFRSEYLGQLVSGCQGKERHSLSVGDVVLIGNDQEKRLNWPLAVVEELIPGRDGTSRVVRLRTAAGVIIRPIQRVYPLEGLYGAGVLKNDSRDTAIDTCEEEQETTEQQPMVKRSNVGREIKLPARYRQ